MKTSGNIPGHLQMIRDFFEKNPGPVLHLSPEGTILYANPVAGSLFTGNELIGNSWLAICPGLDKGNWSSLGEKMTSLRIEAEIRGTIFLFSHVWTKPDGDVLVTGTDITRQKEIEKKLEEQKATISEMARFPDMNPGPVIRMDLQGNILLSNEAATAVFGKNLLKMNWRTICTELGDETWEEVLSSGRIIPVEKMIGDKCYLFLHRRITSYNVCYTKLLRIPPFPLNWVTKDEYLFLHLLLKGPQFAANISELQTRRAIYHIIWATVCVLLSLLFWVLAFQNPREKNLRLIALCTSCFSVP